MKSRLLGIITAILCAAGAVFAAEEPKLPEFSEVWDLLKTNLKDVPEGELSRAAARGLIRELGPRVQIVTNKASGAESKIPGVSRKEVFHDRYAYIRVGEVSLNLGNELAEAWKSIAATNRIRGLVLDLRYAGGLAYQGAAEAADQFVEGNEELARVGDAVFKASSGPNEIKVPLVILVNAETKGAAELLAAILREKNAALLIGDRTAGEARLFERLKLSTGQELLVGKEAVEVSGTGKIPDTGVAPDIGVEVESQNGRLWYEDPYRNISPVFTGTNQVAGATGTNRVRRALNEAELVRRHREGTIMEDEGMELAVPGKPVIMDPVLGRALDLLKGVTTLKHLRPL